MHIPFSAWDTMFTNIENLTKKGGYGYVTLPIAHTSLVKKESDIRHFTILSEQEQVSYMKNRGWKIINKDSLDGTNSTAVWRYYIVQLPK